MSDGPPPNARAAAARERVLRAGTEEFARYGIAGARIERILRQARTSKAQFYDYFGGKEQLFDAIFEASLEELLAVVAVDADNLADWAVRLYDECLARPDLIRIATWHRLERRPTGVLAPQLGGLDTLNRQSIEAAQASGAVIEGPAFDVIAIVIGMAMAWSPVSNVYAASVDEAPATHDTRRSLLRRAVTAAAAGAGAGAHRPTTGWGSGPDMGPVAQDRRQSSEQTIRHRERCSCFPGCRVRR